MTKAQKEAILARTGVSVQITKALASPYEDKSALAAKYGFALTNEANELFEDETIDVIVELIGKIDPAKAFISAALENKKHVVTANKDLIATHGPELLAIAEKAGVSSATVSRVINGKGHIFAYRTVGNNDACGVG